MELRGGFSSHVWLPDCQRMKMKENPWKSMEFCKKKRRALANQQSIPCGDENVEFVSCSLSRFCCGCPSIPGTFVPSFELSFLPNQASASSPRSCRRYLDSRKQLRTLWTLWHPLLVTPSTTGITTLKECPISEFLNCVTRTIHWASPFPSMWTLVHKTKERDDFNTQSPFLKIDR